MRAALEALGGGLVGLLIAIADIYMEPDRKDFVSGEIEFVWQDGECAGWRYLTPT